MKMKCLVSLVCFLSFFVISGCYYDVLINHTLSLDNRSNKTISVLYSNGVNPTLTENNIAYYISDQAVIRPDSSRDLVIYGNKDAWHKYIQEGQAKKLFIYIFDTDTLKKYNGLYSMNNLRNQGKYLMLSGFSETDLNKINWIIKFKN